MRRRPGRREERSMETIKLYYETPYAREFDAEVLSCTDTKGGYDVVLANIVADVIIPLSAVVPHFLRPDGVFICSGILNTRLPEVERAIEAAGLTITQREMQEDWCRLTARRSDSAL